jgi:hypothetical protein
MDGRSTCKQRERVEGVQNVDALFFLLADLARSFLFFPASREGGARDECLGLQRGCVGME